MSSNTYLEQNSPTFDFILGPVAKFLVTLAYGTIMCSLFVYCYFNKE